MPTCCVPGCKNSNQNSSFSLHRFPPDEKKCQTWVNKIRIKYPYEYNFNHVICSWHFPNGKEGGPIRFAWNKDTSFDLHFPDPEIMTRSTKGKQRKEILNPPSSSTRPRKVAPKRKVPTENDFNHELDMDIKIESEPESSAVYIVSDNDPLSTDTPSDSSEGSKRRKQNFRSTMYTTPIYITPSPIEPIISPSVSVSNTSMKTNSANPKSSHKPTYQELEQLLVKSQNELATLKLEKQNLEKDLRVHINENIDLEQSVSVLTRNLSDTKKELEDVSQKLLALQVQKSSGVNKDLKNLQSYTTEIETQLKKTTASEATLKQQVERLKLHGCDRVCKKFDLNVVESWDSYLLYSYFGFSDYSSIQSIIDMLLKYKNELSGNSRKVIKLSLGHQVLMLLLKIRLDIPSRALVHQFGISKRTYCYMYNDFMDGFYKLFYEGDARIIKLPSKQETVSSNLSSSSSSCASTSSSPTNININTATTCSSNDSDNMSNTRRFVIDFIEFEIESRKNTINCTSNETFIVKTLIGCTLEGKLVFVSDLYDEELESNKSIIIKSKFLDQLKGGDVLVCETDFELQDILPNGVSVCTPSSEDSVVTKNMFTKAKQVIRDIVLKIRPLKILNILPNKEPDKIVKVCLGLTTLIQKRKGKEQPESSA